MPPLLCAWKRAAPDRRGDFPVPLFLVALGFGWRQVWRGDSVPPRSSLPGAWKGAPPRRQECRRSFAPGNATLLTGGGTFLSPLFLVALGLRLAGSVEWGFRPSQVLPAGRLERRPSQAARMPPLLCAWKGAAPRRQGCRCSYTPCFCQDLAGSWPVGELVRNAD